jgi:hypothetical protein
VGAAELPGAACSCCLQMQCVSHYQMLHQHVLHHTSQLTTHTSQLTPHTLQLTTHT